jgi:hypothetical protein
VCSNDDVAWCSCAVAWLVARLSIHTVDLVLTSTAAKVSASATAAAAATAVISTTFASTVLLTKLDSSVSVAVCSAAHLDA